jgi:hypothetical protein
MHHAMHGLFIQMFSFFIFTNVYNTTPIGAIVARQRPVVFTAMIVPLNMGGGAAQGLY